MIIGFEISISKHFEINHSIRHLKKQQTALSGI
jgi:hypothetical protein